jgi:hypothetical protein
MASKQSVEDVVCVMEAYFDGLYHADPSRLAGVFHGDARYVNAADGDYMNHSIPDYFTIVDKRTPPADNNEVRRDEIVSIEFGGTNMAFVKATMTMLGRDYLDFLTLIRDEGRWQIISKVFSYTPTSREV